MSSFRTAHTAQAKFTVFYVIIGNEMWDEILTRKKIENLYATPANSKCWEYLPLQKFIILFQNIFLACENKIIYILSL